MCHQALSTGDQGLDSEAPPTPHPQNVAAMYRLIDGWHARLLDRRVSQPSGRLERSTKPVWPLAPEETYGLIQLL